MLKKMVAGSALVLALTGGFATSAMAQEYPPNDGKAIVPSDQSPDPGEAVTFTASGYAPGSEVSFFLFSTPVFLGTAVADANGVATLTATIPAGIEVGLHRVEARGVDANGQAFTAVLTLNIGGGTAVAGDGAGLPATGQDSTVPMAQVGAAALAAGAFLAYRGRRRRQAVATESVERESLSV